MIRNIHILPWWAWGIMSIIFASTLTNVGSIAAIITAIIMVAGLARYQWVKAHPFIIEASLDTMGRSQFANQVNLNLGDNVILIRISTRKATSWDRINIRAVNRKISLRINHLWKYENANQDVIKVTELEDIIYREQGEPWGRSYFESEPDGSGGFAGIYAPALPVQEGEFVGFYVYIRANDKWIGHLSFRGTLENRRASARIKARVNMSRGSSMP